MAGCASCLHKNVHPNVCSDCLGGTHFKPRKPRNKTNADRIRAMTDADLARWIALHPCLPNCPAQTEECFKSSKLESCAKRWLDWLKQETEEGE